MEYIPLAAIVISVLSLGISGFNLYQSYFARPEDLTVHITCHNTQIIGRGSVGLTLVFTNLGKQAIAIEKLTLFQNWGAAAKMSEVQSWKYVTDSEFPFERVYGQRVDVMLQNGTHVSGHEVREAVINGASAKTSSLLVAANSVAVVAANFDTEPVDLMNQGPLVQAIAIRFFDKTGSPHRVLKEL
jgi:hypothetical protein